LLIVSPDSLGAACPLSGRNSTYRPVQILEAGSEDWYKNHEPLIALLREHADQLNVSRGQPRLKFRAPKRYSPINDVTHRLDLLL
jgi:hypothetical protein